MERPVAATERARGRLMDGRVTTPALPGVLVVLDRGRAITSLPAHATEMSLSCGLFLHLLVTSMNQLGWRHRLGWPTATDLAFEPALPATWTPLVVVRFEAGRLGGSTEALARLLNERVTNRAPYGAALSAAERDELCAARPIRLDSGAGAELRVFSSAVTAARVAELVERYAARDFTHREAWAETYRYLSFDSASKTRQTRELGFSIEHLLGPLPWVTRQLLRWALSPAAMTWFSPLGVPQQLARGLARLVAGTTDLVCVASAERETVTSGLYAGSLIMDLWLRATEMGLALHPLSVLVQHDDSRQDLGRALGLAGEPIFLARVGRPLHRFSPSPRRRNVLDHETFSIESAQG